MRFCVLYRRGYVLYRKRIFVSYVEEALLRAYRKGSYRKSFKHGVGIALQNGAVHERAGVALVAVAAHVLDFRLLLLCRKPLPPGGEARAAAAAQAGLLYFLDYLVLGHGEGLLKAFVTAGRQIILHPQRVYESNVP